MTTNSPLPQHYNAIIIGGGGAGLNLLWALMKTSFCNNNSVLIIEPEAKNTNDRTWCFWAKNADPIVQDFKHIIYHVWSNTWVNNKIKNLGPYHYYHLQSSDFYAFVQNESNNYASIFKLQDTVSELKGKQVFTTNCSSFTADYIFDSRLPHQQETPKTTVPTNILWQSFFGYTVQLDSSDLDPQTIHMMNFDIAQNNQCQFVYLLPFSSNRALIEITRFGETCLSAEKDGALLEEWIEKHVGKFTILEKEEGKIPMDLCYNPTNKTHRLKTTTIPIGTSAGNVKCTTGYAFHSMYNHSFAIAQALNSKKEIPQAYHKKRFAFYDGLLLHILRNKPNEGKRIFTQLFQKVKLPRVLLFLDEQTTIWNEIPLLWSLPKKLFISSLFSKILRKN